MEAILLASTLNTLFPKIFEKRDESDKRKLGINTNIEAITRELARLKAALVDARFKGTHSATVTELKQRARELSRETEDCIQRFFKNNKADSKQFEKDIESYKKTIEETCDQLDKLPPGDTASSEKPQDHPFGGLPVGLDGHIAELLELVQLPGNRPSDGRRKVICILGFPGLGKSLLAKQVHDNDKLLYPTSSAVQESCPSTSAVQDNFTLRASVTAAAKKSQEVLRETLQKLDAQANVENLRLDELAKLVAERLRQKRYFIVIDDVQITQQQWDAMNDAFPKNGHGDGIIIVTTTIQSVANVCNGYVYRQSPLDKHKSLDLFLKDRPMWDRGLAENYASGVLEKCDGLPLAIVSVSQILQGRGLTRHTCEAVFRGLGADDLEQEERDLERLRWVLMNKYTGLNGSALRPCLLYFCMYKLNMLGSVPRRNSLMRRWEAEGFLVDTDGVDPPTVIGARNLDTLVDRNIIQSMEVGIDGAARRCRPPGMMLEFISQISRSENFAALGSDLVAGTQAKHIRRLSFDPVSANDERIILGMELSLVLTLVISGIGSKAILTFEKYHLLAVLDLKECTNLEDRHVKYICKLLLLKYLSLGETIGKIPRAIGDLELLETLEMRTTKTVKVYEEVLKLPKLKHLVGNFMLMWNPGNRLFYFLEKHSALERVTGFVTKTTQGFPKLMWHMSRVRKVKIYCDAEADASNKKDLARAIDKFIRGGTDTFRPQTSSQSCSLSMNFTNNTPTKPWAPPLEFLQCAGSLDSLKLRGAWGTFQLLTVTIEATGEVVPGLFTNITGIRKLCLSHTGLSGNAVLATLTEMIALQYLKLEEVDLGPLTIASGTFKELMRLCLVGKTSGITIQPEALPRLVSLHLICEVKKPEVGDQITAVEDNQVQPPNGPEPQPQVGVQITAVENNQVLIQKGCLECLQEIGLNSAVNKDMYDAWKKAAKEHPNRPTILLIPPNA